jgi:hypothetical protein
MTNWITITNGNRDQVQGWVSKAPPGTGVAFRKGGKRSLEQNDHLWPWLRKISSTIEWAGQLRSPEDWKDLFSAALRSYDIVPGLEGGLVQLGLHTSKMTKEEMTALLDYVIAFASQNGIDLDSDD